VEEIVFTPKQSEFAKAVFSGQYTRLLFGGAIRGGKTWCMLLLILALCRIYRGSRWAVVRKDLPTIKRNTLPSFERVKPEGFCGEVNRTDWFVDCNNGSRIIFFPETADRDPERNRWRGLEVNGFALEECNEIQEASFVKAIERAGSWVVGPKQPPPLILATCNPSLSWVKRRWYDPWRKGTLKPPYMYLPSRVDDNPHLPQSYLDSLETLKETDAAAYDRFVCGNWESADEPDQLISYDWTLAARDVERREGKRVLGVDVARYGDDDSVLCHKVGNAITELEYFHGLSLERLAAVVRSRIIDGPIDARNVLIDAVGLGAGVVDILRSQGFRVTEVISGAKAIETRGDTFRFNNLRSQMWWTLREQLRLGQLCFEIDDPRLREDLTAPRYTVTGDRVVKVESKDEIKKRIGRSTDAADAVVYACSQGVHMAKVERFRRLASWR
ncbi:hypothetical protein AMJ85_07490, partial [candidate division BRC1 bacterium SM23_51]